MQPDASKRQVLSDVVEQFKTLFQELWLLDLNWDSKLLPKLAEWWQTCRDDINHKTHLITRILRRNYKSICRCRIQLCKQCRRHLLGVSYGS